MKKLNLCALIVILVLVAALIGGCGAGSKFRAGEISEGVYLNDWLGLRFTKPEALKYFDATEVANIAGPDIELPLGDPQKAKEVEGAMTFTTAYAFYAGDVATGESIQLLFENLNKTTLSANSTEEKYLENNLKTLTTANIAMTPSDIRRVDVAGKSFAAVDLTFEASGTPVYHRLLVCKQDDIMLCIALTTSEQAKLNEYQSCFTILSV